MKRTTRNLKFSDGKLCSQICVSTEIPCPTACTHTTFGTNVTANRATVVPDELQYVEVIAATDKKGSDKGDVVVTADGEEEAELPSTITLLVSPMQANILAELEEKGDTHIALVYRGTAENAAEFIKAQETVLSEIEEKILAEKEKEEAANTENTEESEESEEDPAENILTETDDTTETNIADTEENTDAELFE